MVFQLLFSNSCKIEVIHRGLHKFKAVFIDLVSTDISEEEVTYYDLINQFTSYLPQELQYGELQISGKKWYFTDILIENRDKKFCGAARYMAHFTDQGKVLLIKFVKELYHYIDCEGWHSETIREARELLIKSSLKKSFERDLQFDDFNDDMKTAADKKYKNMRDTDVRFVLLNNDIIRDLKTGLEWYINAKDDTTWLDAKNWAENLNVAGIHWRLPNLEELDSLYQVGFGTHNVSTMFKNPGYRIWSSQFEDGKYWFYDFYGQSPERSKGYCKSKCRYTTRSYAVRRFKSEPVH